MVKILVFIVATTVSAAAFFALKDFVPSNFYVIQSGSMAPVVNIGDLVVVSPQADYFPGEVITFRNSYDQVVTHRIKEKEGSGKLIRFWTKGDASTASDREPVLSSHIIGRVNLTVPAVGKLLILARTSKIIMAGLLAVIVLLALGEIHNAFK